MDKQYIEDNEIGIKYLRKQLTPEEVEEFEIYLMENPRYVDELAMLSVLNEGTNSVEPQTLSVKSRGEGGRKYWFQKPREFSRSLATIVFGVLIGVTGKEFFVGSAQNIEVVEWHELYTVRGGASSIREITLNPQSSEYVALLVDVGVASNENLSIEVLKVNDYEENTHVFDISTPKLNDDGTVMLVVPQQLLIVGSYKLHVFVGGRIQGGAIEFRVSRSN